MKHLGLFAFGVTTCVLVPTALHLLEAGPKQVAKLVATDTRTVRIGKAKVEVALDRGFVDAGAKVHVTLTATAETHEKVTVAVLVYESTGTGGGRVETPPNRVGRDEVTLDIVGGKVEKQLAFTLPGFRGQNMDGQQPFGHYTILVMPPKDADELEKLRRRADRVADPMTDRGGRYEAFEEAYRIVSRDPPAAADAPPAEDEKHFGTPTQIARLDVSTRPFGSPVTIVAPEAAHAGDDLAITVRVKNPSKLPVEGVTIKLGSAEDELRGTYLGIAADHVAIIDGERVASFAAHETKDFVFHVTATTAGTLGLFARSDCQSEQCNRYSGPGLAISDVALDAVDIAPADHPVMVVQ